MRRILAVAFLGLSIHGFTQGNSNKGGNSDCDDVNCFSTEMLDIVELDEGCSQYTVRVNAGGDCAHALSHYTVGVPACATVKDISNSEGWAIQTGTDPTSGLSGFKIDDISGFGESVGSFTVTYTLCETGCDDSINGNCYAPEVAYKAATCVFIEQVEYSCVSLEASIQSVDLTCASNPTGSASLTIIDGVGPFSFLWSNGQTSQEITDLQAGSYSVLITDNVGDTLTLSTTINAPEELSLNILSTDASCDGLANGELSATVSGGTGNYTYSWSTGSEEAIIDGLASGYYSLTVTDEAGCSISGSTFINNAIIMDINGVVTDTGCGDPNGAIDITVDGGVGPYTFNWSNATSNEDITDVPAGLYTVTVSDVNGCSSSRSFIIKENNPLLISANVSPTSCVEDQSGAVDITVVGGSGNYTYRWSNDQATEDIAGLSAGLYSVTVIDETGCTISQSYNVMAKSFDIQLSRTNPSCNDGVDGTVTVVVNGGIEPFTYEWNTGDHSDTIDGLSQGFYDVTVVDATGCTVTGSILVSNPSPISASYEVENGTCLEGEFSVTIMPSGGSGSYTYLWSDGTDSHTINGLAEGEYSVTITDANGCFIDLPVIVSAEAADCDSADDGSGSDDPDSGDGSTDDDPSDTGDDPTDDSDPGDDSTDDGADTGDDSSDTGGDDGSTGDGTGDNPGGGEGTGDDNPDEGDDTDGNGDGAGGGDDPSDDGTDSGDSDDSDTDDGDADDDDGTADSDECTNPFDTEVELIEIEGDCHTYRATITYSGVHHRGLSHWTMALECGNLSEVSNNAGFPIEYGTDPTTGLSGFKIDDIDGFGEGSTADSFEVYFTICTDDISCRDDLKDGDFEVAYKYGQCVTYDLADIHNTIEVTASAYPNPFAGQTNIVVVGETDTYINVEVLNRQGVSIRRLYEGYISQGERMELPFEGYDLPNDIYTYKVSTSSGVYYGRIILMN